MDFFKKICFSLMISVIPLISFALEINVTNDSDLYATGHADNIFTPCSSFFGDIGVAKPHASTTFSTSLLNSICWTANCTAFIYMTNNCSGKKIATVIVNKEKGVLHIENHDEDHYIVYGGGNQIGVKETHKGLKGWFRSLFA